MKRVAPLRRSARIWCLSLVGLAAVSCEFGDVQYQLTFTGANHIGALSVAGVPGTAYVVSRANPSGPSQVRGYDTTTGALIGTTPTWSGGWEFVGVEKVDDHFGGGPPKVISLHQNGHIVTWPDTLGSWTTWDSGYMFEKTRNGDFLGVPGVDADYVCDFESKDGKHWLMSGVVVNQATGLRYPYVEHVGYYIDDVVNITLDLQESPYAASSVGPFQNHCPKIAVDAVTDEFRVLWRSSDSPEYVTTAHRYRWDLEWDGYHIVEVDVSPHTMTHTLWSARDQSATHDVNFMVARQFQTILFDEATGIEDLLTREFGFVDMSDWWTGSDATRRLWVVEDGDLHAVSFVP